MPLVAAKCTQCGANLQIDSAKDAAVCPYCNTPFVTEKAINNYNTYNQNNYTINGGLSSLSEGIISSGLGGFLVGIVIMVASLVPSILSKSAANNAKRQLEQLRGAAQAIQNEIDRLNVEINNVEVNIQQFNRMI